jgi:Barstar (barnase inhibitor)
MAPFRLNHDELQHELPWRLMQNGPVTKYWRRDFFDEDVRELAGRGYSVALFDCSAWRAEEAMLTDLRDRLAVPNFTGRSFDALSDSLTDIHVPYESGLAVALDNFNDVPSSDVLLQVLGDASRWWLLFGRVFAVLLRTDDPAYGGPVVGGTALNWNGREWLNSDRGL